METNIDSILQESGPTMYEKRKGPRINLCRSTEDCTEWISTLYSELFTGLSRRNVKRENTFRMILVNLAALKGSPIIVPLHRSYWKEEGLIPHDISIRGIGSTVTALEEAGYLNVERGYRTEEASAPTIVLPTDALLELMPEKPRSHIRDQGLIRCDDFENLKCHEENVQAQLRELALKRYNSWFQCLPSFQLYALFKGGYDSYGRLHGSVLHHIPKEQRHLLIVDGEPTFEIDIKSCLPFIALALRKGIAYEPDIYRVPGLPRELMKKAVLIGLNNKSKKDAVVALQGYLNLHCHGSLPDGSPASAPALYHGLEETHPVLKEIMYKDSGLYLMNIESMHMAMFLYQMTGLGVPVFPIHDGVLARVSDREIVKERFIETFTINDVPPKVAITVSQGGGDSQTQ